MTLPPWQKPIAADQICSGFWAGGLEKAWGHTVMSREFASLHLWRRGQTTHETHHQWLCLSKQVNSVHPSYSKWYDIPNLNIVFLKILFKWDKYPYNHFSAAHKRPRHQCLKRWRSEKWLSKSTCQNTSPLSCQLTNSWSLDSSKSRFESNYRLSKASSGSPRGSEGHLIWMVAPLTTLLLSLQEWGRFLICSHRIYQ